MFCFIFAAFPRIVRILLDPNRPMSGAQLEIDCFIDGFPSPTITWTKDNITLSNDSVHTISMSDSGLSRLKISKTKPRDSGVYTCIASNDAGSVYREIRIDIAGIFINF